MLNFLFFSRFFSDYFWEYKFLSILALFLAALVLFSSLRSSNILNRGIYPMSIPGLSLLLLSFLLFFNFFYYGGEDSLVILAKVVGSFLLFTIGRYYHNENYTKLYVYFVPIFLMIILSFLTGTGFQFWGNIQTFSGGYFFKTDLALAVTIFLCFVLCSNSSKYVKIGFVSCGVLLVLLSNARVYYAITPLLIVLYFFRFKLVDKFSHLLLLSPMFFLGAIVLFYGMFSFVDFLFPGRFLLFDVTSGFDEANSQGRNLIWDNIIHNYSNSSYSEKLFGQGLVADVQISYLTGVFESSNAHNSFLYLLTATGAIGLFLFLFFVFCSLRAMSTCSKKKLLHNPNSGYLFVSLSLIFIVSGLTNVQIIFQQVTWFYFFFCGVIYQISLKRDIYEN